MAGSARCAVEGPFTFIWLRPLLLSVAVKENISFQIRNKNRNMII
jgi:hypothetical protein